MRYSEVNIIVFTQSTDLGDITAIIRDSNNSLPFLLLSSHRLFDTERNIIIQAVKQNVVFMSFADFLTDEEMACCDMQAYDMECKKSATKRPSLAQYYNRIKRYKNRLILKNIQKKFNLVGKHLCADDLGILADVWMEEGFTNEVQQRQEESDASGASMDQKKNLSLFPSIRERWKRIHIALENMTKGVYVLKMADENYIFLGSIMRIRPHLDKNVDIKVLKPGQMTKLLGFFLILTKWLLLKMRMPSKILNCIVESNLFNVERRIIRKYTTSHHVSVFLSSMHEYSVKHTKLANSMNMDLMILQDGFLPENYSSKYLAFYFGVKEFWVWDRLSLGLFKKHHHKAKVSPLLSVSKLPIINKDRYTVKTILVLTSGAGDWTALKNRSDEDLMIEAFVKVAKHFQDIQIIYRCHPLWAHPQHQGINSIIRVDQYFKELGLENIMVSSESLVQSQQFIKTSVLGVEPSSLDQDLSKADIVFGEHSFTMIDTALREKLFASVNLTKRRDFFQSYSKLGFAHLTSTEEIISFIEKLQESPVQTVKEHNEAVQRYNTEWYR